MMSHPLSVSWLSSRWKLLNVKLKVKLSNVQICHWNNLGKLINPKVRDHDDDDADVDHCCIVSFLVSIDVLLLLLCCPI